ncbi:hypothetical protein ACFFWB_27290 [Flavobacterium procerum]|uniref:hypothetical protein n=1 Tax=Flavobacterium procerum TaxID=1455569 RepID=UPI0035EA7E5B
MSITSPSPTNFGLNLYPKVALFNLKKLPSSKYLVETVLEFVEASFKYCEALSVVLKEFAKFPLFE